MHKGRNGSIAGAVVVDNEPIRKPELPILRILGFAEGLERSAKDSVFTIQNRSSITIVGTDGALKGG